MLLLSLLLMMKSPLSVTDGPLGVHGVHRDPAVLHHLRGPRGARDQGKDNRRDHRTLQKVNQKVNQPIRSQDFI